MMYKIVCLVRFVYTQQKYIISAIGVLGTLMTKPTVKIVKYLICR